jgi:hypothetical protein
VCSYLDEADILALLPETLAAEVETVFANETGGVCADTTVQEVSRGHSFSLTAGSNRKAKVLRVRVSAAPEGRCDDTEGRGKGSEGAYQDREPLPNWRGRLYQTLSCDMMAVLRIVFCSEGGSAASEEMLATIYAECVRGIQYGVP